MPSTGTDTIYNLAEKGVYNFSCDGTKIEFMSGTSVFMPYTYTDALSVLGTLTAANITVTGALDMTNGNINNVNNLTFNDAGGTEGVGWTNVKIVESPDDLSNATGDLQFLHGGARQMSVRSGAVEVTGEIRGLADVVAYYTSDKRMKDNIVNISDPLGKLKQIRGVYFDWNEKGPDWTKGWPGQPEGKIHDIGVIAQEVQKVLPEVVIERKGTGMLAVDYQKIVPLLIEGINEQQKHIESLELRIEKLENK
jgi:hypothetical protein